jgi:cardiolipin synthase
MNLPNTLTLIRVLLIPIFVILIINKHPGWALITFALAGITDGMDGVLARVTHQRTELGAYLDPIADKLLLSSAFITLAITEMLPSWLTVIVITRDLIILVGFLIFILINYRPKMGPSLVSKVTTFFQISTILLVLIKEYDPAFRSIATFAIYGTALFTVVSGSHYIYLGTRILNGRK